MTSSVISAQARDGAMARIVLGGNMLGTRLSTEESFALLDAFVEWGGRTVDTAAVYSDWEPGAEPGASERTIGSWLRSRGMDALGVATKGGHPAAETPMTPRLDAAALRADVEQSLTRLGLEQLTSWFAHRDDPRRPVDDIVADIEQLREEGLIRSWGLCNWATHRLCRAVELRDAGHAPGFAATQAAMALVAPRPGALAADLQAADSDMLALHRRAALPLFAYSAQAKGYFDKVGRVAADDPTMVQYDTPANRDAAAVVSGIATTHSVTPTQAALAGLLAVDPLIRPIVGCSSTTRLRSVVAAAELTLTPDEQSTLRRIAATTASKE